MRYRFFNSALHCLSFTFYYFWMIEISFLIVLCNRIEKIRRKVSTYLPYMCLTGNLRKNIYFYFVSQKKNFYRLTEDTVFAD